MVACLLRIAKANRVLRMAGQGLIKALYLFKIKPKVVNVYAVLTHVDGSISPSVDFNVAGFATTKGT